MVLGGIDLAGAEQDREHRQQHRQIERRLAQWRRRPTVADAAEHLDAHRPGLELQRDVRHRRDQRDHRHQCCQTLRFAVARTDEIGDRGDVLLVRHLHQTLEHTDAEHEQQDRAEIDRQEAPARGHRNADRAVERPRGTVDRQRQAVDDRAQHGAFRIQRPAVTVIGHREQQRHIQQRHAQQDPSCNHPPASLVSPRCGSRATHYSSSASMLFSYNPFHMKTSFFPRLSSNARTSALSSSSGSKSA